MLSAYDFLKSCCVIFIWNKVFVMDEIGGRELHSRVGDHFIHCSDL